MVILRINNKHKTHWNFTDLTLFSFSQFYVPLKEILLWTDLFCSEFIYSNGTLFFVDGGSTLWWLRICYEAQKCSRHRTKYDGRFNAICIWEKKSCTPNEEAGYNNTLFSRFVASYCLALIHIKFVFCNVF